MNKVTKDDWFLVAIVLSWSACVLAILLLGSWLFTNYSFDKRQLFIFLGHNKVLGLTLLLCTISSVFAILDRKGTAIILSAINFMSLVLLTMELIGYSQNWSIYSRSLYTGCLTLALTNAFIINGETVRTNDHPLTDVVKV
ncbi:MAG: hypothetical protein EOO52_13510 [Gammaproteobacteria bacterium]|nr:MAG: hypothetical protein EOO52_13510 [Gammaproteobacteria bacterium]